mgnify:CR=1 FL=1
MEKLADYVDVEGAGQRLRALAARLGVTEFAQVRNLEFIFAPFELYPLAPLVRPPLPRIAAFATDMDGTSTTTEPLALHALEYMVRRVTGRLDKSQWSGLDPHGDYPHVIGNSNFRHTEFLLQRYGAQIDQSAFTRAFFEALLWTRACMPDVGRRQAVVENARHCGLGELLQDADFSRLATGGQVSDENVARLVEPLLNKYGPAFHPAHESQRVAAALDIYYMRYHSILRALEAGQGERLARELLGSGDRRLVEPMPGYEVFVPLVKGWLGAEADALFELLRDHLLHQAGYAAAEVDATRPRLVRLAEHFRRQPARIALVTASIAYEAQACMKEVVRVMAERVAGWPLSAADRGRLADHLADYRAVYDGFVCASDTWEARLKPHRDLYSLALFQMSVPKEEYCLCVGLEDTEPGIIALRAAGVGCAIALPNRDTHRQNYTAASAVLRGGLPELILLCNLLLPER